ncbi:MAG: Smr/MutS family protein [Roseovarius sp.]
MSRRKLRPDELELWKQVAKTTDRLHPEHKQSKPEMPFGIQEKPKDSAPPNTPIEKFEIGQKANGGSAAHRTYPTMPEEIAAAPVSMDKKAYGRLKRGKLKPEARIDLHGMTLAQARPALTGFIMRAHAEGQRLVLVITGKGKRAEDVGPIPARPGVLRHNVPHWLQTQPLGPLVLQISPAHLRHGGQGAYYVYLRRSR